MQSHLIWITLLEAWTDKQFQNDIPAAHFNELHHLLHITSILQSVYRLQVLKARAEWIVGYLHGSNRHQWSCFYCLANVNSLIKLIIPWPIAELQCACKHSQWWRHEGWWWSVQSLKECNDAMALGADWQPMQQTDRHARDRPLDRQADRQGRFMVSIQ